MEDLFTDDNKENVLDLALAGVYVVVVLTVLFVYLKSFRTSLVDNRGVLYFVVFLELGAIVRGGSFALAALDDLNVLPIPASVMFMLETSPSFFFFSVYMILLYLWGEVYQSSRNHSTAGLLTMHRGTSPMIRVALLAVNAVMYLVAAALYILDMKFAGLSPSNFQQLHDPVTTTFSSTIYGFIAFMYGGVTLGFFVYGYVIYRQRLHVTGARRSTAQRLVLKRVGLLAACCMLIFTARGVLTLIQIASPLGLLENKVWWIDGLYYPLLEIIPVSLMLAVIVEIAAPAASAVTLNYDANEPPNYKTPLVK